MTRIEKKVVISRESLVGAVAEESRHIEPMGMYRAVRIAAKVDDRCIGWKNRRLEQDKTLSVYCISERLAACRCKLGLTETCLSVSGNDTSMPV